jgi:hypothetical protein
MSTYLSRPRSIEQAKAEAGEAYFPVTKAIDYLGRPQQGLFASMIDDQSFFNAMAGNTDLSFQDVRNDNYYVDQVFGALDSAVFEPLGAKGGANVAMDALADPLTIPLVSAFKNTPRLGDSLGKTYSTLATGLENFIDGFYGGDRAGSMGKWVAGQVKNLVSPFSEKSLKIMEETGLTKPVIDILAKHSALLKGGHWATDLGTKRKMAAQLEHVGYTLHRAGIPTEELPPVIQNIIKGMSVKGTGFQPESFDNYWDTVGDIPRRFLESKTDKRRGNNFKPNKGVVETLYKQARASMGFENTAKMPTDMVVRASDNVLGDFQSDAFTSGVAKAFAKFFQKSRNKKPTENAEELAEGIKNFLPSYKPFQAKAQRMGTSGKQTEDGQWVVDRVRTGDDGVYIDYSGRSATATRTAGIISASFLEGGVNMQVHFNNDGIMTALISDKYDFLEEQLPTEALFKNEIFGVTLPIVMDVKAMGSGKQFRNTDTGGEIEDPTEQALRLIQRAQKASSFKEAPVANIADKASQAAMGSVGGGMLAGVADTLYNPESANQYQYGEKPMFPGF